MAKNNDTGVLLFFGRKVSVVVGVQEMKNGLVGIFTAVILKGLHKNGGRVFLAEAVDQQDFRVDPIIVPNKTTYEADDNDGRSGRKSCGCSGGL